MADYFSSGMRLYLDHLVDWKALLEIRSGGSADVDAEVGAYRTILETASALAASFEPEARKNWAAEAELTPDGGAQSPPHIRRAYDQLREAGLVSLTVSERYGGYGLPALLNGVFLEMISRADPSLMMVVGLQTGAASDIERYGSDEVKDAFLPRFTSGEVQGSMDLTEPEAGSDLGGIATRVTDLPDGRVRVDGQKIYISNGGAEIHLVLARTPDAPEGTRGISLFVVPKFLLEADGSPGRRNDLRCVSIEHKLGIHGSPTAAIRFESAEGFRVGPKGQGFKCMLSLMNNARLGVAAQGIGIAEAALSTALEYAKQREQFGAPIINQPLMKNMLARMTLSLEASRAILYRACALVEKTMRLPNGISTPRRPNDAGSFEKSSFPSSMRVPFSNVFLLTEPSTDRTATPE